MPQQMKGIVPPPYRMPEGKGVRTNNALKVKTPLLITLFAWLCFFRAGIYLVFALIVGLAPESSAANYLSTHFDSYPREASAEIVFFVTAFLYGLIGWRWYSRDWRARWVAMFMAGANVALTMIALLADRASGLNTPLTDGQQLGLMVSSTFNLLILLYLAFYPGMAQAFRETPWD
ncbi:MAG: hypothetical protein WAM85_16540 [Terracidiphilus sp.]